jgi:hypothetical protein
LTEANRLNDESLWTFALVSDLTTFIHLGDILRIVVDERTRQPSRKFIELKTGKWNEFLAPHLDALPSKRESLATIAGNTSIAAALLPQAERMMRQRIRLDDFDTFVRTGKGTVGGMTHNTTNVRQFRQFDEIVERLATIAKGKGLAGATIDDCLHLGIGFGADAEAKARQSVEAQVRECMAKTNSETEAIREEFKRLDWGKLMGRCNLIESNLQSQSPRPFFLWRVHRNTKIEFARGDLVLLSVFNVCKFIHECRTRLNIKFGVESQKASGKLSQGVGRNLRKLGTQYIWFKFGENKFWFQDGMVSRFWHDLCYPLDFMAKWNDAFQT